MIYLYIIAFFAVAYAIRETYIVHRHVKQAERYQPKPVEWVWVRVNRFEYVLEPLTDYVRKNKFWVRPDWTRESDILVQFWECLCEPMEEIETSDIPQPGDNWPEGVDIGGGD